MALSVPTGFPAFANATPLSTLSVTPVNVGDAAICTVKVSSTTVSAATVTGGGVGTWYPLGTVGVDATDGVNIDAFYGIVTAAGAATLTVASYAGGANSFSTEITCQNFHSSVPTIWTFQAPKFLLTTGSVNINFPTFTTSNAAVQAYYGYGRSSTGTASAGSTTGFVWTVTASSNLIASNVALATNTAISPVGVNSSGANDSYCIGVVVTASPPPGLSVNQAIPRSATR